jgi:hypothetical protein
LNDLDEAWALALEEARRRAHAAGRTDVADYLALRASNDLLRQTGIEWLIGTFLTLAGEANRNGASIQTSRQEPHRFVSGGATLVGHYLSLRFGIRELAVEAGWPRTPRDGFIRGGGLARGLIRHLGRKTKDREIVLVRSNSGSPHWLMLNSAGSRHDLNQVAIQQHIATLLRD